MNKYTDPTKGLCTNTTIKELLTPRRFNLETEREVHSEKVKAYTTRSTHGGYLNVNVAQDLQESFSSSKKPFA